MRCSRFGRGAPIYVDGAADPDVADGLTAKTAFATLLPAVLTAFAKGGANVWVREGELMDVVVPIFDGTHLYGGFDAGFKLEDRDPLEHPTVLHGAPGLAVLDVRSPLLGAVLDGLLIAGDGVATIGVDAANASVSLRGVHVQRCTGRGIRLRSADDTPVVVQVLRSSSTQNGADGLSGDGAFDLRLDACVFESNVQEGVDLDDLVAPRGGNASLRVRACVFRGNGTDGLDVDLAPPLVTVPGAGRFVIRIESSTFEGNAEEGLLLDVDYEGVPAWSADITVRACRASRNGDSGIHLDLDAQQTALVHGSTTSANGADGIWISSESAMGVAVVAACFSAQNGGAGIRASFGNQMLLISHCALAGNAKRGIVSETVPAGVVSSIAHRQFRPWSGARVVASVATELPVDQVYVRGAEQYAWVVGFDGTVLSLDAGLALPFGALAELDDDGLARSIQQFAPSSIALAPAPLTPPGVVAVFTSGSSVEEDLSLVSGSPAAGVGLGSAASPVDAGPLGAPGARAPGVRAGSSELFRILGTVPAPTGLLASSDTIAVAFDAPNGTTLDPLSVTVDSVRAVAASGAQLAVGLAVVSGQLFVMPPASGWPSSFHLELFPELSSTNGDRLATPVVVPFTSS